MTKGEFMRELERLLSKVPENEKRDALEYYNDYFAEAGIADDMLVPTSMGAPEQIAETIIRDAIYGEESSFSGADGAYTESGYTENNFGARDNGVAKAEEEEEKNAGNYQSNTNQNNGFYYENGENGSSKEFKGTFTKTDNNDNTKLIVAIILLVVFSPAIIGAVSGIGGTLIGAFAALVAMVVGFIAGGVAVIVAAVLSGEIAVGIFLTGIGLLLIGLGLGSVLLLTMYCGQFIPWLVNQCVKLIQWISGKKEQIL